MHLNELLAVLKQHRSDTSSVIKTLNDIARLDSRREENLRKLGYRLDALESRAQKLDQAAEQRQAILQWVAEYRHALEQSQTRLRNYFGDVLQRELQKIGLPLSGQYPTLKAGLFVIEPDFEKDRVTLWYGPRQERLEQCPMSPPQVVARVDAIRKQLGSQLEQEAFVQKLRQAYSRLQGAKLVGTQGAPIIDLLGELAHVLQGPKFLQNPIRENYRGYGRADFSYDLFKIRCAAPRVQEPLTLVVATRAYARRRKDFLWVPDDESGRGSCYSHLRLKEISL